MADYELKAAPRSVFGKKTRFMRREGRTPGNIFGHRLESVAIETDSMELTHLLKGAGRNVLIDLQVEGEKKSRPVMVKGVQREPTTGRLTHVDFYQVSLKEKMHAEVRLVLTGEAPAVNVYSGVLLQSLDVIQVEALPTDIPVHVEVDVSKLEGLEDAIHVRDLAIDEKVTVLTDLDVVVAKVAPPRVTEAAEEAAAPAESPELVRKAREEEAAEE